MFTVKLQLLVKPVKVWVASQATAYKAEIDVKMIDQKERTDAASVYAAKIKRKLEKVLVGAKVKTVPVGILGTAENATLGLIVTGPSVESAMKFAKLAEAELRTIPGTTEIKLTVEDGNPEINVQVDRDKMSCFRFDSSNRRDDHANCL